MKENESGQSKLGDAFRGTVVEAAQSGRTPGAGHEDPTRGDRLWVLLNQEGEVRVGWRLMLLVVSFLVAAYLLRYVPIRLQTRMLSGRGLPHSAALARARHAILDDPVWSSVVGIAQGLLWYPLVCFLITVTEGRPCTLRDLGLSSGWAGFLLALLGAALATAMFLGYIWVGTVVNRTTTPWSWTSPRTSSVALTTLNFVTNGFGEETAFRAYMQERLVQRHGLWDGIALTSVCFVLLHALVSKISGLALLACVMLAAMYGMLFFWTRSVYLVGTMHAIFNLAPRLLNQWPTDAGLLLVHSLGLMTLIVAFRWSSRGKGKLP